MTRLAPALATLEQSRANIGDVFDPQRKTIEAERGPLEDRYAQLLKDITGYTTKATAQEFGRRGIPLSSGVYDTALAQAIEPQVERIGLEREAGLRNLDALLNQLAASEAEMGMGVDQAIAQIQSATGMDAVQAALSLYQMQQQQQQFEKSFEIEQALANLQQQQFDWQKENTDSTDPYSRYIALGQGQTLFDLQDLQSVFHNQKYSVGNDTTNNNNPGGV